LLAGLRVATKNFPKLIISVDSFRAEVAEAAIKEGAHIVNDVSGGNLDPNMFETVGRLGVPYILMHMRGTPKNMKGLAQYDHVVKEVYFELAQKIETAKEYGIDDIVIDPGFGFAKTIDHNYEILDNLDYFSSLGYPILAGISRKSMIYKVLETTAENALNGTTALNMATLLKGAAILRVHDVREAKECVKLFNRLRK
jgi:dihydropteroate synthase